jgi:uncharacterized membrane protein YkoI
MSTTFHLDTTSELNADFLKAIKTLFKNQRISVTVEAEMDTTDYLMSNEANRKSILESIAQADRGELIKVKLEDL